MGKRGATVNIGKKGTRGTVGISGSGLSYSFYQSHAQLKNQHQPQPLSQNNALSATRPPTLPIQDITTAQKQVSLLLGIGIFFIPIIFAWFTLRQGYSTVRRAISMVWMLLYIYALR